MWLASRDEIEDTSVTLKVPDLRDARACSVFKKGLAAFYNDRAKTVESSHFFDSVLRV